MTLLEFPSTGFIRAKEICKFIPMSQTAWWQGVKNGKYPQPVVREPRYTAWRAEDILDLIKRMGGGK